MSSACTSTARPWTGVVEDIRYWPGKFLNAAFDKASTDNERCAYRLRGDDGQVWSMVQIAGLVARRIVCRERSPAIALARGQRYGMIRFGSRVDLYLPRGYVAAVRIGRTGLRRTKRRSPGPIEPDTARSGHRHATLSEQTKAA